MPDHINIHEPDSKRDDWHWIEATELLEAKLNIANRRIKELEAKVAHLETVVTAMGGQFIITNTIILDRDHPRVVSADVRFMPE